MITLALIMTLFAAVYGDSPHDFNEPRRHAFTTACEAAGEIPYNLKYAVQTRDWKKAAREITRMRTGFNPVYQGQLAEAMYSGEWQYNEFFNNPADVTTQLERKIRL